MTAKKARRKRKVYCTFFAVPLCAHGVSAVIPPAFSECLLLPYIIIPMISALLFILPVQLFYVGIYH